MPKKKFMRLTPKKKNKCPSKKTQFMQINYSKASYAYFHNRATLSSLAGPLCAIVSPGTVAHSAIVHIPRVPLAPAPATPLSLCSLWPRIPFVSQRPRRSPLSGCTLPVVPCLRALREAPRCARRGKRRSLRSREQSWQPCRCDWVLQAFGQQPMGATGVATTALGI